ncbi:MAG: hypothetical protein AABX54_00740 [Nanoarchaeota archaeon]
MLKRSNKKAIEMGFNWLFAIIAGGFILFIAVYSASKFIGISEQKYGTESAAKFVSLFDPLEIGLVAGKSSEIDFVKNTRVFFDCDADVNAPFGRQTISFSEQMFGKKWSEKSNRVSIKNKYVFSENVVEGKRFYLFSFPFSMPFSIGDIVITESGSYCFYDAPNEIVDDIEGLNIKNVIFPNLTTECNGIKVCFGGHSKCDIKVSTSESYVEKNGKKMYYYGNLIYGAIFSSPENYECNVKRLMSKLNELGKIYISKIKIMEREDCEPKIEAKLSMEMGIAKSITSSRDLIRLGISSEEIDEINEAGKPGCKLY